MAKYFGTDGVRGVANEKITSLLAFKIGRFLGYNTTRKVKILISQDTRKSGQMLSSALCSGIVASGGDAYNIGVSTTPSVSFLVEKHNFDFGVMISASHNPFYDNGIKIFNNKGEKLEAHIEEEIEKYIDSLEDYIPLAKNDQIGSMPECRYLIEDFIEYLVSKCDKGIESLKILIDCANGSASAVINQLIKSLSLNATVINNHPNGININDRCGSTHISVLKKYALKEHYDLIVAFDGDADRCLLMDCKGNVIDGDAIIYLNAVYMKEMKCLNDNKVVLTVMSNLGVKKTLEENNISFNEVGVGDKYVQANLKENNLSLGGEQSGHIIFPKDLRTGCGLLAMIKVLNILNSKKENINMLLKDLKIYPQCLKNVVVVNKDYILSHDGLKTIIKSEEDKLNGNGRILVRASGTEQLIRVMCEAETELICNSICDRIVSFINELQ